MLPRCACRIRKLNGWLRTLTGSEQFKGIGPKYARNILMIVYHPDFRQSIAVDERIKSVSRELGLSFGSYDEEEQFYVNVAARAGLRFVDESAQADVIGAVPVKHIVNQRHKTLGNPRLLRQLP